METFLPGSLSSESSLSPVSLSLQPYGFTSGIKMYTARSEMESNKICIQIYKVVIGWEIRENNLQKVVKKSGQQETIEQLEEGKQQMSAVANQLLSTPSLKVLWFKWKLYYLVTVFMTLKL